MNKNNKKTSILLFSKDSDLFAEIQELLENTAEVRITEDLNDGQNPDISLIDVDTVGISLLSQLKESSFVIILTREKGSRYMIESMTFGAFDCLSIPINKELFGESIGKALRIEKELEGEVTNYTGAVEGQGVACAIVGDSPMLQEVCKLIGQMGRVDVPILITGESGTGKDLVAESIWKVSTRWSRRSCPHSR